MSEELSKLDKVRGYVEAPSKPPFFDQSLTMIGGRNPLGEPNLIVGWGWDLRMYRRGDDQALKYPGPFLERWILEKWLPPEFFGSQRNWEQHRYERMPDGKKIDLLGEFPRQGRYGMVMPLMTALGEYIPLGSEVLVFIDKMQSDFLTQTKTVYSDAKRYAQLQEKMATEEKEMQQQVEAQSAEHEDYLRTREFDINKEKAFSMPTLWTPNGEHQIH